MTQANESNDRERSLERQLRIFDRRLTRLEETQLTGKEINLSFDRVYEEIDALEDQMNARFDQLENSMNAKLDAIMQRLTGLSNS
jgi:hypothetical protein